MTTLYFSLLFISIIGFIFFIISKKLKMNKRMSVTVLFICIIISIVSCIGLYKTYLPPAGSKTTTSQPTPIPTVSPTPEPVPISYNIVNLKEDNFSTVVRHIINVTVAKNQADNLIKIANEVVNEHIKTNTVNAISVRFFLNESDINIKDADAVVDWAPYGDWAKADNVKSGEYSYNHFKIVNNILK